MAQIQLSQLGTAAQLAQALSTLKDIREQFQSFKQSPDGTVTFTVNNLGVSPDIQATVPWSFWATILAAAFAMIDGQAAAIKAQLGLLGVDING